MRCLQRPVLRNDQRGGQPTRRAWSRPLTNEASGETPWSSSPRTTASSSGDHGLLEKLGFFPQSYHILGIWRDPRKTAGRSITEFTENVDLLPTLADALGVEQPVQCDGASLAPLLAR